LVISTCKVWYTTLSCYCSKVIHTHIHTYIYIYIYVWAPSLKKKTLYNYKNLGGNYKNKRLFKLHLKSLYTLLVIKLHKQRSVEPSHSLTRGATGQLCNPIFMVNLNFLVLINQIYNMHAHMALDKNLWSVHDRSHPSSHPISCTDCCIYFHYVFEHFIITVLSFVVGQKSKLRCSDIIIDTYKSPVIGHCMH
jgi:hypothetical protein